jgi:hypothetical protein
MFIDCPLPTSLKSIPLPSCPFKLDQIVRIIFQRRQPLSIPPFATLADIQTLTNWNTLLNAVGNTKAVVSPLFAGLVIPQSEALTTGGNDNSTINGIPDYNGEGSVTVTGVYKNLPPVTKRAIDALVQESLAGSTGVSNLTIYFVNRYGYIYAHNPLATGTQNPSTNYFGVPAYNYRISSLGSEGLNAPNTNGFSFSMPADWADHLVSIKPSFDALGELGTIAGMLFNSSIKFDTTVTPPAVAGVTAVLANAIGLNPTILFEFDSRTPLIGAPITLTLNLEGADQIVATTQSDYTGSPFRLRWRNGNVYAGAFIDGKVTF